MKIKAIEIENFKNIDNARIEFRSNLAGIYGPNGTGKTAVIEAVDILAKYFDIRKPQQISDELKTKISLLIKKGKENCQISIEFEAEELEYKILVRFGKDKSGIIYTIKEEVLKREKEKRRRYKSLISILNDETTIIPEIYISNKNMNTKLQDEVYLPNSLKFKELYREFNNFNSLLGALLKIYLEIEKLPNFFVNVIEEFEKIALTLNKILVITLKEQAYYNLDLLIPLSVHNSKLHGMLVVNYKQGGTIYDEEVALELENIIKYMNNIFQIIVPKGELVLEKTVERLEDGKKKIGIKILVKREGIVEPLLLERESTGIIKLVSLLSAFIYFIQDKNAIILIDELDIHIFEYLLANFLEKISKYAKGQLIFTGHNLFLLERLDKDSIIISTKSGESIVYTYLKNVSKTTNLRQKYIRSQGVWTEENIEPLFLNSSALEMFIRDLVM